MKRTGEMHKYWQTSLHAGWLAALWFAVVVGVAGLREGHEPMRHAVGALGAVGAAHATLFNLLGFIVPGLLLFVFVLALERWLGRDGMGRSGRLATGMLMVSALAFAAQGVFAFDPEDMESLGSRLHASLLACALLGLMAGAAWLAASVRHLPGWAMLARLGPVLAALLLVFLVESPQHWLPPLEGRPGHAQRLIFAVYFLWFALAAAVALARARAVASCRP